MKQVTSILKMFFFALLLIGGTACTSNFADINRKDYEVDKNELGRENYNLGATLRGLQGLVVPVKEHLYQFIEALAAGPYAGYFGATNPWTTKFETYNPSVDWQDKHFPTFSPKLIRSTVTCATKAMILSHWHYPNYCA